MHTPIGGTKVTHAITRRLEQQRREKMRKLSANFRAGLRAAAVSQHPSETGGENPLQSPGASMRSIGRDCGVRPFAAVCDPLSAKISASGEKS
jgi:hypothetical protein